MSDGIISYVSPKAREVWSMLSFGINVKETASNLGISTKTVEHHKYQVCKLFNINRNEAMFHRLAVAFGLVDYNPLCTCKDKNEGISDYMINLGKKLLLVIGLASALNVGAAQPVPLRFIWNNPLVTDPGASNLQYRLYATTNLSLPTNQWQVILIGTNYYTNTPMTLVSTNYFAYDNWFFYISWTNVMWKKESFFSNQAVPDRLPNNFLNFNLNLQPTP